MGGKESRLKVSRSGGLSLYFSERLSCFFLFFVFFWSGLCPLCQLVVFRATGRQTPRSFEGQHAPRSPDKHTNDKNIGPHNSYSTQYEDRSNAESTDLQNCCEEGRLCITRSSVSTQRGDASPQQPSWSLGSSLLRFNALTLG